MKIRSIQQSFGRKTARTFAACGVMAGAFLSGGVALSTAYGQSGNQNLNAFGSPAQTGSVHSVKANGSKSIVHGDTEYRVMTADGVPTAASANRVATVGSMPQNNSYDSVTQSGDHSYAVNYGGGYVAGYDESCNTGNCGNSYGGGFGNQFGGGFGNQYGGGNNFGIGSNLGCGALCEPYMFAMVEGLYMQHQGDGRSLIGSSFRKDDFDFEFGARITIGSVPDCVNGMELTYVGPFEWDLATSGTLDPALDFSTTPGAISTDSLLKPFFSDFTGVNSERTEYDAEFWSLEVNKTLVGWEVAKVLIGGRYIDYDETYSHTFSQPTASGLFLSETENSMAGLQVGLDMLFPISCHGYVDFRGRAGGYLNFSDATVYGVKTVGADPTTLQTFSDDDTTDIAGVFEFGTGYRYELGQMLSLRAGIEGWYVTGVANAQDQARRVLTQGSFQKVDRKDDFFVVGANFGAQFKY